MVSHSPLLVLCILDQPVRGEVEGGNRASIHFNKLFFFSRATPRTPSRTLLPRLPLGPRHQHLSGGPPPGEDASMDVPLKRCARMLSGKKYVGCTAMRLHHLVKVVVGDPDFGHSISSTHKLVRVMPRHKNAVSFGNCRRWESAAAARTLVLPTPPRLSWLTTRHSLHQ